MNDQQMGKLARALIQECSAQTLGLLGDALSSSQGDGGAGVRAAVEIARDMRQEAEQAEQQAAPAKPRDLGEALQQRAQARTEARK